MSYVLPAGILIRWESYLRCDNMDPGFTFTHVCEHGVEISDLATHLDSSLSSVCFSVTLFRRMLFSMSRLSVIVVYASLTSAPAVWFSTPVSVCICRRIV